MNTQGGNMPAPERGSSSQFVEVAGYKIDIVKDEAEDYVLDLVDDVAAGNCANAEKIAELISKKNQANNEFGAAALKTMKYLVGAYSQPDYRFRPDLNPSVDLHHVNDAEVMLRRALAK
jgi:hypothetical protein